MTGHMVVDMAMVDVTRTVLEAGQFGIPGAQDVIVYIDSVSMLDISLDLDCSTDVSTYR